MKFEKFSQKTAAPLALIFLTVSLWGGCQSRQVGPESTFKVGPIDKIVMLPVTDMSDSHDQGVSYRCPVSGRTFIIGDVAGGAEAFFIEQTLKILKTREGMEVVSPGQVGGVQASILRNNNDELSERVLASETGKALGADAVILSRIYRYTHRSGTDFAAKLPAGVSFSILLIDSTDGKLLWEGHFAEVQRSLSENLFNIVSFFKRNMRWLTAEELAVSGLEEVFKTFPSS